ncbi:MAG: hypothetical protein K6F84_00765, partial [Lachnospiraceae bacterium]|nr:hypothetical protein [Lachnospiraceae bacterium]
PKTNNKAVQNTQSATVENTKVQDVQGITVENTKVQDVQGITAQGEQSLEKYNAQSFGVTNKNDNSGIYRGDVDSGFTIFIGVTALFFAVLTLKYFPWDYLSQRVPFLRGFISSIQFPTRFLSLVGVTATFAWGYVFKSIYELYGKKEGAKSIIKSVFIILCVLNVMFTCVFTGNQAKEETDPVKKQWTTKREIWDLEQIVGYVSGGEYLLNMTDMSQVAYDTYSRGDNILLSNYVKGSLVVNTYCENIGDEESYFEVPLFAYTGFTAESDLGKLKTERGTNNRLRVTLPGKFNGYVKISFKEPLLWRISEIISLLGVVLFVICSIKKWSFTRKNVIINM